DPWRLEFCSASQIIFRYIFSFNCSSLDGLKSQPPCPLTTSESFSFPGFSVAFCFRSPLIKSRTWACCWPPFPFSGSAYQTSMDNTDQFYVITEPATGAYKDRGSRFLAYAFPLSQTQDFKPIFDQIKAEHPKARHHCFAYRLGFDGL